MRIGMYTPTYPGITGEGGIGTYTQAQARALVQLGHQVHVLSAGDFKAPVDDEGVQVHSVPNRHLPVIDRISPGAGAAWRVSRAAGELTRKWRLDIFEFANWEGRGISYVRKARIPTLVRLATSGLESQQIDGTPTTRALELDVRREHQLARSVDLRVTHSEAHRQMMAAEIGISASEIDVVPLGIACRPEFFRPPDLEEPHVVFLGRMEKRKGTADLLQAIPQVLARIPGVRFLFIGADRRHCPGERTHQEFADQELSAAHRSRVSFLGRLSDTEAREWLQRATIFVAPSLYESFGLVFIEAMRWGTPVIGTNVGGIPEIVTDGLTGRLVPPSDPRRLAGAILELLESPEQRQRLGQAGRGRVEAEFTIERMAAQMVETYREAGQRYRARIQ